MPVLERGKDHVIMKVKGALLEILVSLAPELYGPYVVQEKGKRVIYLEVLRALLVWDAGCRTIVVPTASKRSQRDWFQIQSL